MYVIFILLWFCFPCRGEVPFTVCGNPNTPYKVSEETCASFNDICVMKGNIQCDNFQALCSQCPISNFSVFMYHDVQNLKNQNRIIIEKSEKQKLRIDELHTKVGNISIKIEILNKMNKEISSLKTKIEVLCGIIIFINITMAIILIVEIRFKLITKFIENKNRNGGYQILGSRKKEGVSKVLSKCEEVGNQIQRFSDQKSVVKFHIINTKTEIEFKVYNSDCIVEVKKKICSQLPNTKYNNCKIMRLKYNGNILDDNRYLLPYITDGNITVECEIDRSINDQDIVIIKVESVNVPKLLQLRKQSTIGDLKIIISRFINLSECFIVKKEKELINNNQTLKLLKDEFKIEDYQFKDKDCVKVLQKRNGKLYIRSIFQDQDQLVIEYTNLDLVSTIIHIVANKFGSDPNYFLLFLENEYLDENKCIFEYNIHEESPIKFYCLMKISESNPHFRLIGVPIDVGSGSQTYEGEQISPNKKITVIKFNFSLVGEQIKKDKMFLSGIAEYQITKLCNRFVQFINMCDDGISLYVTMDYMAKGTLTTLLDSGTDITKEKIVKWSKQILEGLKYQQDHNIFYTEIKSNVILADENEDLKLRSFKIPGFVSNYKRKYGDDLSKVAFVSPEKENEKEEGNERSIVWSFGVLLLDIVNKKDSLIMMEEVKKVVKEGKLKDKLPPLMSNNLKNFIDCCLKIDPDQRSTITQLTDHIFLQES